MEQDKNIRNGTSGTTAVASNEEQPVFSLLEVGVRGLASPAGNVFHCSSVSS